MSVDETVEKVETSDTVGGSVKWCSYVENSLAGPEMTKRRVTI